MVRLAERENGTALSKVLAWGLRLIATIRKLRPLHMVAKGAEVSVWAVLGLAHVIKIIIPATES